MISLRLFMAEQLTAVKVGYLPSYPYSVGSTNSVATRELSYVISSPIWNGRSYVYPKNIIPKPAPSTTNRNIVGNGQNLTPIRTLDTFNIVLIFQCMTRLSIITALLMRLLTLPPTHIITWLVLVFVLLPLSILRSFAMGRIQEE